MKAISYVRRISLHNTGTYKRTVNIPEMRRKPPFHTEIILILGEVISEEGLFTIGTEHLQMAVAQFQNDELINGIAATEGIEVVRISSLHWTEFSNVEIRDL